MVLLYQRDAHSSVFGLFRPFLVKSSNQIAWLLGRRRNQYVFQEQSRPDMTDTDIEDVGPDAEQLRSILAASGVLQPAVVTAKFARIHDRFLEEEAISTLSDPAYCPHDDAIERCEIRGKVLAPYVGKRLICISINLPGVAYTIEIDPFSARVVHWDCVVD